MDLIYADENRVDIGTLFNYEFELSYGKDENDFSLSMALDKHCLKEGYIIYEVLTEYGREEATDYGGIVDKINVDTEAGMVTYKGRTWHGILEKRIIQPDSGQDYKIVTGTEKDVIQSLLDGSGLASWFKVSTDPSIINIAGYKFKRYEDMYAGLADMLSEYHCKLQARYEKGMVTLSVKWISDYSKNEEWDQSQIDFRIEKNYKPVNHLICLGSGDLRERHVIHLYTDANGGIQPYAAASPVKDSDYFLDDRSQIITGIDEVVEVYDYPNAETKENYEKLSSQPADWAWNYTDYFILKSDGTYESPEETDEAFYEMLSAKPADWETEYANYFVQDENNNYVAVKGIDTDAYTQLSKRPVDWETNYGEYYVHFWDGTAYSWRNISGVTEEFYTVQTQKPTDWETNYRNYYEIGTTNVTTTKNKNTTVIRVDGTGFEAVKGKKKGESEIAPQWKSGTYYNRSTVTMSPDYNLSGYGLPKYKKTVVTTAPAFPSSGMGTGIYRTSHRMVKPPFKAGVTYRRHEDHYADLVANAIERLNERWSEASAIDIDLNLLGEHDVGDIVGASERRTGIAVWQAITKKVVKITRSKKVINYMIGDVIL